MICTDGLNRTILLCRDYVASELSDKQIALAFHKFRVLCVADAASISSHSGQTALVTLTSLLSRMGMQVGLAIPDVAIVRPQPPITGLGIRTALTLASDRLMPGAEIVSADFAFSPDIVFTLGAPDIDYSNAPAWRMDATDMSGSIHHASLTAIPTWTAKLPIGGMVAALLAANEAFKSLMRRLRLRQASDQIFFAPLRTCHWDFGPLTLPENPIDLGRVDFISAGAITQAALYTLLRISHLQMQARVFDDDSTAISNLNRNMLTTINDVDAPKVDVIASRCNSHFDIEPIPLRFISGANANIRLAPRVIVGVDDIPSRWAVQREAPSWVGVAGTSHFSISSSSHGDGEPCSGCLHPVDDPDGINPIPTISFVSLWAGLSVAVRLIREALRSPYPANRQQLWLTPLRLDLPRAGMWSPVPAVSTCPVRCSASRRAGAA